MPDNDNDNDPTKDSTPSAPAVPNGPLVSGQPEGVAVSDEEPNERPSYADVVEEIRAGKWGAKKVRRQRLIAAGYDYKAVMKELMK